MSDQGGKRCGVSLNHLGKGQVYCYLYGEITKYARLLINATPDIGKQHGETHRPQRHCTVIKGKDSYLSCSVSIHIWKAVCHKKSQQRLTKSLTDTKSKWEWLKFNFSADYWKYNSCNSWRYKNLLVENFVTRVSVVVLRLLPK